MCPPAACTWLMQLEYAECGGCHFEIVVPEIAHWTSPTVCGSSVWIAPRPKVIPGPTPLALVLRVAEWVDRHLPAAVLPPHEQARVARRAFADRNSPAEHVRLAGQDEDLGRDLEAGPGRLGGGKHRREQGKKKQDEGESKAHWGIRAEISTAFGR